MQSVTVWLLLALVTGAIAIAFNRMGKLKFSKCIALSLLVFYLAFVLTITIIERIRRTVELDYDYDSDELAEQYISRKMAPGYQARYASYDYSGSLSVLNLAV